METRHAYQRRHEDLEAAPPGSHGGQGSEWKRYYDEAHQWYYAYNEVTGESKWIDPEEGSAPSVPRKRRAKPMGMLVQGADASVRSTVEDAGTVMEHRSALCFAACVTGIAGVVLPVLSFCQHAKNCAVDHFPSLRYALEAGPRRCGAFFLWFELFAALSTAAVFRQFFSVVGRRMRHLHPRLVYGTGFFAATLAGLMLVVAVLGGYRASAGTTHFRALASLAQFCAWPTVGGVAGLRERYWRCMKVRHMDATVASCRPGLWRCAGLACAVLGATCASAVAIGTALHTERSDHADGSPARHSEVAVAEALSIVFFYFFVASLWPDVAHPAAGSAGAFLYDGDEEGVADSAGDARVSLLHGDAAGSARLASAASAASAADPADAASNPPRSARRRASKSLSSSAAGAFAGSAATSHLSFAPAYADDADARRGAIRALRRGFLEGDAGTTIERYIQRLSAQQG